MKEKQIRSNSKRKQYDVFLSHASKDKSDYVESLYMVLRRLGISYWTWVANGYPTGKSRSQET